MTTEKAKTGHLDLASIRARLESARGPQYWRSLEELADTEEFRAFLQSEFPRPASLTDAVGRRQFLKLMGASLALAGLNACTRQPREEIFPYAKAPEEIVPGTPLFFATAMTLGGFATGVLVESHMGRPTKIEGNPDHPASLGATDVFAQASVLTLYDPDRSQVVLNAGAISTWNAFVEAVNAELEKQRTVNGAGLRVLTETVTSPTLAHQLRALLTEYPQAAWHQYEPVSRDNVKAGARLAFGEVVETQYRFDRAAVILSLDADFLSSFPGSIRYARDFASARRASDEQTRMNRLYVIESTPSITGSMADHRLPLRASQIEDVACALAQELGMITAGASQTTARDSRLTTHENWITALAGDLQAHRGSGLIVAGEQQPPIVHALAHAMNDALGNVGSTVVYTDPVEAQPVEHLASLRELVADIEAGRVETLIMIGGNPVFTSPVDLRFAELLTSRVRFRAHLSLYEDETSELCQWHIPEAHSLEMWSDARAFDGTASIIQPLIAPLYNGKSAHEVLASLLRQPNRSGYDVVRQHWKNQYEQTGQWSQYAEFEPFWQTVLHNGVVDGTALPPRSVELKIKDREALSALLQPPASNRQGLEILFRPDPTIWDGRFANNGWLQELPKPLTKLTWDNAALISPKTAEQRGLSNEDVVQLSYSEQTIQAPIWIMPGQPDDAVTVHLGYGRRRAGTLGTGIGFNPYRLRRSDAPWFGPGLEMNPMGRRYQLASTQHHHSMENRHLVRVGTVEDYEKNPAFAQELGHDPPPGMSLYPEYKYDGASWGMAIDLNACTGCNACVIACQSENNIPVVGKEEVAIGREMHWIRIDRYYEGRSLENPTTYHQPVLCMHCDHAPCEVVCPTGATNHSSEGLNQMVYNRCVGTRYCSNNCPYKVRRFNFRLYTDWNTESLKLQRNPDVTVRSRGVMEKCTYCVQRINAARIEAKKQDREIQDGEVVTACQQVCPSQAIVFGNLNDPGSRVARLKADPRNYGILTELNTRPRTTYLARLRNPNPEIEHEQ